MSATADALMGIFWFKRVEGGGIKTDRELLELAAKAAGIPGEYSEWYEMGEQFYSGFRAGRAWGAWNPLTDDGDALRLAEEIGLTVCMDGAGTVSACDERRKNDVFVTQSIQECGSRIAATRRAIVRAAAAIGEGME